MSDIMRFFAIALFFLANTAFGEMLETENYKVVITKHCDEGEVSCEDISYIGTSKRSGNSIILKGKTLHQTCADGITPCRFLGYRFQNGNITYKVYESGLLQVIREPQEILLEEQGNWSYD